MSKTPIDPVAAGEAAGIHLSHIEGQSKTRVEYEGVDVLVWPGSAAELWQWIDATVKGDPKAREKLYELAARSTKRKWRGDRYE
jgi:hypothetical protein